MYIYYQIVDADCKPYRSLRTCRLERAPHLVVDQLGQLLEHKFAKSSIPGIDSATLKIFGHKSVLTEWELPLALSSSLEGLGMTEEDPVIAMVPILPPGMKRGGYEWSAIQHPRKIRWKRLNEAMRFYKSEAYIKHCCRDSHLCDALKKVFILTQCKFNQVDVTESKLEALVTDLSRILKFYPGFPLRAGRERVFALLPIVYSVCEAFSDAQLSIGGVLSGDLVEASVAYDILITRPNNVVVFIVPQGTLFDKAYTDVQLACEILAESRADQQIHGIMTDLMRWDMFRSSNEAIQNDFMIFDLLETTPLKQLTGKLINMLVSEQERKNRTDISL